jgi:DNA-binding response OmpR family regulator
MVVHTVAVVDHDPVFLRLMQRVLSAEGYRTLMCPRGTAAHDLIAQERPSVVLIETWLDAPEQGWELLQTLRLDDATRDIPVVILSSDSQEVRQRAGQLEGLPGVTLLGKPFDPDTLLTRLREVLGEQ